MKLLNETYHSKYGAVSETEHVYINNGLKRIDKTTVNVCEIGFGTGLSTLQTLIYAINNNLTINYFAYEKYPLTTYLTSKLNYGDICNCQSYFDKIHNALWEKTHKISDNFTLLKNKVDVLDANLKFPENLDIVYFDAFAPSKQSEMWNADLFSKLYFSLSDNGILVSYASAGVVKRALRQAGFEIKRLPGYKGKFHMLLAKK